MAVWFHDRLDACRGLVLRDAQRAKLATDIEALRVAFDDGRYADVLQLTHDISGRLNRAAASRTEAS